MSFSQFQSKFSTKKDAIGRNTKELVNFSVKAQDFILKNRGGHTTEFTGMNSLKNVTMGSTIGGG